MVAVVPNLSVSEGEARGGLSEASWCWCAKLHASEGPNPNTIIILCLKLNDPNPEATFFLTLPARHQTHTSRLGVQHNASRGSEQCTIGAPS